MVDSNPQTVAPELEQDEIPYIQRSTMTQNNTQVEERSESRGSTEWLKLIIFIGAILLVSYLAISVISPILFRDYVPGIMGLEQSSDSGEPIDSTSPSEIDEPDEADSEATNSNEESEPEESAVEEENNQETSAETEPLPAEENQAAKVDEPAEESEPSVSPYIVQPGETLTSIAAAHGITVEELLAVNDLLNPNFLYAGQEINIPN
ncbi:MAG: LysM domain-containing protein [Chloroflexota bacterium]